LDIHQFFSTLGDMVGKVFGFNPVLENIVVMKVAIIVISLSLLISSLALLVLAISHSRLKKTRKITSDQILDRSVPSHD
jgi:hypothetical protein